MKDFIKKINVFDIIIGILFLVINILSFILFKWLGLLSIPIFGVLIFIYYNSKEIGNMISELINKNNKSKNKKNKKGKNNKTNNKSIKNSKNKNKNNSIDDEFDDDDDIIIKKKKTENVYETKDVDMVKINNKKKGKSKKNNKSKNKKKVNKEKKTGKQILKGILIVVFSFCIFCVLSLAAFLTYIVITTPNFDPDKLTYKDQTVVYDKNSVAFATLGTQKRESVTYDELPQVLVDAIIATEDSRFFQHNGVDFARFLKASFEQLLHIGTGGGASTLTMQVSKNNLTNTESRGIKGIIRKFRDIYISVFQIEKKYTKEQIIEFYVNDNLLGGSNYGVEQASQYYFGKSVSELNLAEAATIAGIFQSPNAYRPDRNPEGAEKRRNTVLYLMKRHGYITEEEEAITKAISVESLVVSHPENETYQGFLDTVTAEVESKTGNNPYEIPMKIYTTLDTTVQNGIDDIMEGKTYTWQNDVVQAGVAVVDVNTGEVIAIGAGRTKDILGGWNYATQERNHPGSTAKPLFDYGPGFEYSNYSTYTLFNDEPWSYTNGPAVNNWDSSFHGLMTLRTALSQSRNIPALKAFQQNNKKNILDFVTKLGITPETPLHEAHAIGGFNGVTPLELSAAYATFANGGYYIEPHTVTKIIYRDNDKEEEFKYTKERVMSASTAFLINNVLQYAVETGYGGGARVYGKTVAAKTGTSTYGDDIIEKYGMGYDAVNDLWTAAYTPQYSFALWYGYKERSSEYYNTNTTGAVYKNNLMSALVKVIPMTDKAFDVPDTVVQSQVEFGTWPAQLPSEYTPKDLINTEYFIKGTQPTETSQRFTKFTDVKNLETTKINNNTVELTWNYDMPEIFTETYLKKYFSQNVFGNGTDSFVKNRLNYYGGVGYGIYTIDENNNLTKIDFTTDKEYRYTNTTSKDVHIVVKVQYKDFDGNASNGVENDILIRGKNSNSNSDSKLTTNINSSGTYNVGNYVESDFTIKYNGRTISKDEVTIKYSVNGVEYFDKEDLVSSINSLSSGTYTITYTISYKDETEKFTKRITLN